jgi:hypothetical protein
MFSVLKKSLAEVVNERVASPFYGTFIITWCIWNWKIIYLTVFVDQELIKPLTKIQYIEQHYSWWLYVFALPMASTLVLIAGAPYVVNIAYKIHLRFESQRRKMWEDAEKERMISRELYAAIRKETSERQELFERGLKAKEDELQQLRLEINEMKELNARAFNEPRILFAEYRTTKKKKDVSTIMKSIPGGRLKVVNEIFDDIDPGAAKELFIVQEFRGKISNFTVPENTAIEKSAEDGWRRAPTL